jgi:hypothetical protein
VWAKEPHQDMCNLVGHPDFFNTENCWWGQSSKGKAWAARGEWYLPKDLARTLATQPTDQQKLASIHMSKTSTLKPYVLMCSLSFRPAYEEARQIKTRVAFDTQAQTDRSLISAGLIEKLNNNIDNSIISSLIRNENCTCMKICSILDREWYKER